MKCGRAIGPDLLSNHFLNDTAEILVAPICSIINSSIRQGIVPTQWKLSRVTPLPKCIPPKSLESDIRPISITSSIAKIAEGFISSFFNEHFSTHLDINQFGCTGGRSTTLALIKILHPVYEGSDDSNNFIRILFVDFTKAFDRIDHNKLLDKLVGYNFPPHVIA